MNKNKICFICCVNDERLFEESLRYIHSLPIPDGFELDVIDVREAESMASGYNAAMKSSNAKYKVYLHQDTLIINKNFIFDVLHLFQNNQKLGLIGLTGARKLASNGVWWESKRNVGKVYESHTGRMSLLAFEEVHNDYEQVEGIDGFIMITQEDVDWREDLFQGWHLYDISQVFEFKRAGFEVGVPKQESPWCIHDCGKVNFRNGYEENRLILLEEYALDFQPLVSVM
ncbi:MAG: glycosyltransferase family protein, partial [Mobilitalea sp.]